MLIKICGMRRPEDALQAARLGVDWVGVLVGQSHASSDFVEPALAARIARAVRDHARAESTPPTTRVMLVTHLRDPSSIVALVREVDADGLQLHGGSAPAEVREIERALPHLPRTVAVHMTGPAALMAARHYRGVDGFLLDSVREDTDQVGGTGQTHDWSLSRAFVERYPEVPVWLAGGLHAGNVQRAIDAVGPAGVDVNTGTRAADGFKDLARMRAFVAAARRT